IRYNAFRTGLLNCNVVTKQARGLISIGERLLKKKETIYKERKKAIEKLISSLDDKEVIDEILYKGRSSLGPFNFNVKTSTGNVKKEAKNPGLAGFRDTLKGLLYKGGHLQDNFHWYYKYIERLLQGLEGSDEVMECFHKILFYKGIRLKRYFKFIEFLDQLIAAIERRRAEILSTGIILDVPVLDSGAEIKNKVIIPEKSAQKLGEILALFKSYGLFTTYLYNRLFKTGRISKKLHKRRNDPRPQEFISVEDKNSIVVVEVSGYQIRDERHKERVYEGVLLEHRFGNNFSCLYPLEFEPFLDNGKPLRELMDKAKELGLAVKVDFIPWIAPDSKFLKENYKEFVHFEVSPQEVEQVKREGIDNPREIARRLLRQNDKFFILYLKEKDLYVRVAHPVGIGEAVHKDQALPNFFSPVIKRMFIEEYKKLIDLGIRRFRIDLVERLLKDVMLGQWKELYGFLPQSVSDEPLKEIIKGLKSYTLRAYGENIIFSGECYDGKIRRKLLDLGLERVYYHNVFLDAKAVVKGEKPAWCLAKSLEWAVIRSPEKIIYASNFDEEPIKFIGSLESQKVLHFFLFALGLSGVPVMIDLRDLLYFSGHIIPIVDKCFMSEEEFKKWKGLCEKYPSDTGKILQSLLEQSEIAQLLKKMYSWDLIKRGNLPLFLNNSRPENVISLGYRIKNDFLILLGNFSSEKVQFSIDLERLLPQDTSFEIKDLLSGREEEIKNSITLSGHQVKALVLLSCLSPAIKKQQERESNDSNDRKVRKSSSPMDSVSIPTPGVEIERLNKKRKLNYLPFEYPARLLPPFEEPNEEQKENFFRYIENSFNSLGLKGVNPKEIVVLKDGTKTGKIADIETVPGKDAILKHLAPRAPPLNKNRPDSQLFQTLVDNIVLYDVFYQLIEDLDELTTRQLISEYFKANLGKLIQFKEAIRHFGIELDRDYEEKLQSIFASSPASPVRNGQNRLYGEGISDRVSSPMNDDKDELLKDKDIVTGITSEGKVIDIERNIVSRDIREITKNIIKEAIKPYLEKIRGLFSEDIDFRELFEKEPVGGYWNNPPYEEYKKKLFSREILFKFRNESLEDDFPHEFSLDAEKYKFRLKNVNNCGPIGFELECFLDGSRITFDVYKEMADLSPLQLTAKQCHLLEISKPELMKFVFIVEDNLFDQNSSKISKEEYENKRISKKLWTPYEIEILGQPSSSPIFSQKEKEEVALFIKRWFVNRGIDKSLRDYLHQSGIEEYLFYLGGSFGKSGISVKSKSDLDIFLVIGTPKDIKKIDWSLFEDFLMNKLEFNTVEIPYTMFIFPDESEFSIKLREKFKITYPELWIV
ncbi:hypothetical protein DRH29_04620, partial [candidate division Kazan bacterium]